MRTEVICYAKKELRAGTILTGPGGFECYGLIEARNRSAPGLPICLSSGARLVRTVQKDDRIEFRDAEDDSLSRQALHAYREALAVM
jgi:predicted homoserine dehydrogenase-like protein